MSIANEIQKIRKDAHAHNLSDLKHFKGFSDSIKLINEKLDAQLSESKAFREEMRPVKDAFDGLEWSGWAIAKVAGFIGVIAGAAFAVKQFWNK